MNGERKMYEADILVVIYPSMLSIEKVLILDPFDQKILSFDVSSLEEVKEVLRTHLPFCSQGHDPLIHMGDVIVMSWGDLPDDGVRIKTPEDVDKVLK